jgi:hypothetical protein
LKRSPSTHTRVLPGRKRAETPLFKEAQIQAGLAAHVPGTTEGQQRAYFYAGTVASPHP